MRKGKTTFPFAFKIPIDAPISVMYGNMACLKYIVTGQNLIYKQPVDVVNMKQLWMVQGLKIVIMHILLILANKNKKEIDEVKIVGDTIA
ncbi:14913_t:CDS:2 [Funneliformis geosporum]|nr:14913_t:CDS:2 [Funneliformis geosporum]